jgi:hypothetical protein
MEVPTAPVISHSIHGGERSFNRDLEGLKFYAERKLQVTVRDGCGKEVQKELSTLYSSTIEKLS